MSISSRNNSIGVHAPEFDDFVDWVATKTDANGDIYYHQTSLNVSMPGMPLEGDWEELVFDENDHAFFSLEQNPWALEALCAWRARWVVGGVGYLQDFGDIVDQDTYDRARGAELVGTVAAIRYVYSLLNNSPTYTRFQDGFA